MVRTASGILAEIVQHKRDALAEIRPFAAQWERCAYETIAERRALAAALAARVPAVIAEVKKASPSRGLLQPDFHPAAIATNYEAGGAACLSVLTDEKYFLGSLADLQAARAAVALPVLRKDFTVDPLHVFQAAAHGADAVLLIAAVLDLRELTTFRELAAQLGMAALVEVHDEAELHLAIDSGAKLIGVNNRNLATFEVSLDTSLRLSELIPAGVIRISESGIHTRADIDLLRGAGFEAFLIGESLMRSPDPAAALRALVQ